MNLANINQSSERDHPLNRLPGEDLDLIKELVLQSGSLKGLAQVYGVSYPTIRSRLDRVIDRLRAIVEQREPDALTDLLATLIERGEITPSGARRVREAVRDQLGAKTGDAT